MDVPLTHGSQRDNGSDLRNGGRPASIAAGAAYDHAKRYSWLVWKEPSA